MSATLYDLIPRDGKTGNDVLLGTLSRIRGGAAAATLSRAGIGHPGIVRGEERHPEHAHRLGQIARGHRAALPGHRPGATLHLHLPDQGAGEREVHGALPRVRPGQRRPQHRRRVGESRRAHPLLHGGNSGEHRVARRRGGQRAGRGHGRIPLLRRPRARRGVAGSVADVAANAFSPDVRDAGRHDVFRGGTHAAHRAADGDGCVHRPARAAGA